MPPETNGWGYYFPRVYVDGKRIPDNKHCGNFWAYNCRHYVKNDYAPLIRTIRPTSGPPGAYKPLLCAYMMAYVAFMWRANPTHKVSRTRRAFQAMHPVIRLDHRTCAIGFYRFLMDGDLNFKSLMEFINYETKRPSF